MALFWFPAGALVRTRTRNLMWNMCFGIMPAASSSDSPAHIMAEPDCQATSPRTSKVQWARLGSIDEFETNTTMATVHVADIMNAPSLTTVCKQHMHVLSVFVWGNKEDTACVQWGKGQSCVRSRANDRLPLWSGTASATRSHS